MAIDSLASGWAKAVGVDRKQFDMFFDKMLDGFAYHRIVVDKAGKPVDYLFLEVNRAFEKMTGLKRERIIGKKVTEVLLGIEKDPADWIGVYGKVALSGEPVQFENYNEALCKWFKVSAYCPEKGYFVTLFEDITERKKAELEMAQAKQRLEAHMNNAPEAVIEFDPQFHVIRWSEEASRIFGWSSNEVVGRSITEMPWVYKEDVEIVQQVSAGMLNGKSPRNVSENRNYRKNGTVIDCEWYNSAIYDEKGNLVSILSQVIDITERKKAEDALKEAKEQTEFDRKRLETVLETSPSAVVIIDAPQGKFSYVNKRAMQLYGFDTLGLDLEENVAKVKARRADGTDYPIEEMPVSRSLKLGEEVHNEEMIIERPDGYSFPIIASTAPLRDAKGNITSAIVVFEDITERKKAEVALSESEARLRAYVSSTSDVVYRMSADWSEMRQLHGNNFVADTEKPDRSWMEKYIHPDDQQHVIEVIKWAIETKSIFELEHRVIQVDGSLGWTFSRAIPLLDKDGEIIEWFGTAKDVTERKKAEEALGRQAELIDLSPDAIIVRKLDGTVSFWSKGAEKLYGWTKEEAMGQEISIMLKTKFPQPVEEIIKKVKMEEKWSGELTHITKNGETVIVQSFWLGKLGTDGKIESILESNVDITDRIRLQAKVEESTVLVEEYANQMEELANKRAEQLKDAERLATIGATAGMVGHDIRNPLQAITGDVFLAKTELIAIPDSEEKMNLAENLTEIEKNVDYINKIVADLQDFARPLNPITQETDLKLVIDDLLKKNGLPDNVKVTVKVENDAKKVVADSTFINRIMYNLVTNAVQAMPKGGKLTIHAYKEAKEFLITVKDTGVGIPEKVRGKLFTPMFTTKSKGQGFGLAVIKRMTESLGGTVSFESEEGKGTTFTVRLPLNRSA
jgi:PAS domain S-box-containing protein